MLVAVYLILARRTGDAVFFLRVVGVCLVPWLCVCFPDVVGEIVAGRITQPTPPAFVWALGWVVLLLPVFATGYWWWVGAWPAR